MLQRIKRWLFGPPPYHIETFVDHAGWPRWRLVSSNKEKLASSEAYSSAASMARTVDNVAGHLGLEIVHTGTTGEER